MAQIVSNKLTLIFISLLIAIAVFLLIFFIIYNLACIISPPYFVDDKGEKYPVMPMGQAFLGIIFGVILSIVSLVVSYRKLKKIRK
jgi:ABC-type antimicrobial peptide transport system permease subunit